MNSTSDLLELLLAAAALAQTVVAILNLQLERILGWKAAIAGLPPLIREVFVVHKWFISITLFGFAAITLRFAPEIAGGASELSRWIAAVIGLFWSIRTFIQWGYYSHNHWIGKRRETAVHWTLTFAYAGLAGVYLFCAFR